MIGVDYSAPIGIGIPYSALLCPALSLPTRPLPLLFAHDEPIRSKAVLVDLEHRDPRHKQSHNERGAHRRSLHPLLHALLHNLRLEAGLIDGGIV